MRRSRGRFRVPPDSRSGPPRTSGPAGGGAATALRTAALAAASAALLAGCGPRSDEPVPVRVHRGQGALAVGRELARAGLVRHPRMFALYARVRGAEDELKSGRYRLSPGATWEELLDALREGRVVTEAVVVPPGFRAVQIADRVARVSGVSVDSVERLVRDTALARALGVPGPSLEGYLFPDTYRFARGVAPAEALRAMARRYREFWGPEERARLDSLELSERQAVTLASIVEEEVQIAGERQLIAGVYLNRLRRGMPLQADPTVRYALNEFSARLLYRDIRRVAASPYNTYTRPGLPPGPISSPSAASVRAVLYAPDVPFLYFVARPDGSHAFSVTHRQHINAKNRIQARQ